MTITVAPFLVRLMTYTRLSQRVRLGPEDLVSIEFANRLRVATIEGRLRAVWTHPANELATRGVAAAIARAAGLITGASDFLFLASDTSLALEAKSLTGSLTPGQRDFRDWCAAQGVPFHVFRSADQGEAILRARGLLT